MTNLPGKYVTRSTAPSTGARFECTLKTFMKTEIFSASRSPYGSRVVATTITRPSAGDSTSRSPAGTGRAGSRKNCSTNTATSQNGSDHHPPNAVTTSAATVARPR